MSTEDLKDLIDEWIEERLGNIYPASLDVEDVEQLADYIYKLKTLFK